MPFDWSSVLEALPLAFSGGHPGVMQGFTDAMQRIQQQKLQQQQLALQQQGATRQDQLAQAQIQNLSQDNARSDAQLALQRLTAARQEGQGVLDTLIKSPETMLPPSPSPESLRPDGTTKGSGFLGTLGRPDGGVSSEISVGVNIDGREVTIPTLVPTLDPQERQWLLSHDISDPHAIPASIIDKAVAHARKRMASGLSPFADGGTVPAQNTALQAQNALVSRNFQAQQAYGVPPGTPQGPLPNMTALVSEGKKRRAKARYDAIVNTMFGGDEAMAEQAHIRDSAGEFVGKSPTEIRALFMEPALDTRTGQPAVPVPNPKTEGTSDLQRSFQRAKRAHEQRLGRPMTAAEQDQLDRTIRREVRAINAPPALVMVQTPEGLATFDKRTRDVTPIVTASGSQLPLPATAEMRNKQAGRALVANSIGAVQQLSESIITKVGPAQRVEAIKRGAEAVFGNDPMFRTYQDARTALAGNLAVAQQGSRPSDADVKAIWLPLVPDAYRDTAESASLKWNLIRTMSNAPAATTVSGPAIGERRRINGQIGEWDGQGWKLVQ